MSSYLYIQNVWNKEFDLKDSAFKLLKEFNREDICMSQPYEIKEDERTILDNLIKEFEVSPELVETILYLVTSKYPTLDFYGAKTGLKGDIESAIEKAIHQEDMVLSNDI
ncbi:sulfurtransferase DndC [Candidatus Magnetoovum chiemensis]|nr:sulfurtransferase DndC [Candidatus Magnetoovum chiemensis]